MDSKALGIVSSYLGKPLSYNENVRTEHNDATSTNIKERGRKSARFHMLIICFSKDRAFQLSQFIRSLCLGSPEAFRNGFVRLFVIWTASAKHFEHNYFKLKLIYPFVEFIREEKGGFKKQVELVLEKHCFKLDDAFVLFAVDDALFYRRFDLQSYCLVLYNDSEVLAFQMKLAASIEICQPKDNELMRLPEFQHKRYNTISYAKFELHEGQLDWSYPFDLACGLYRAQDIYIVFQTMKTLQLEFKNPNELEQMGNEAVTFLIRMGKLPAKCASHYEETILSVLTVNRVQTKYKTPVIDCDTNADVAHLDQKFNEVELSIEQYGKEKYKSVHIGSFFLRPKYDCSVLIPVRNSSKFLEQALQSLEEQKGPFSYQVILIDDCSSDKSFEIAKKFAEVSSLNYTLLSTEGSSRGVGAALNLGLKYCSSELIARMDADDICSPDRLYTQIEHLEKNQQIFAAGSAAYVVEETVEHWNDLGKNQFKKLEVETESIKIAWNMYFSCSLIHPTVVMRRGSLIMLGGYVEGQEAEDYDLWFRAIQKNLLLSNIISSKPLLMLRKHQSNVSKHKDSRNISASTGLLFLDITGIMLFIAQKAIDSMLSKCSHATDISTIYAIQFGSSNPKSLESAFHLIEMLEAKFLSDAMDNRLKEWIVKDVNKRLSSLVGMLLVQGVNLTEIEERLTVRGINKTEIVQSMIYH